MNQNWKSLAAVGVLSSLVTVGGLKLISGFVEDRDVVFNEVGSSPSVFNRLTGGGSPSGGGVTGDFTYAAEVTTPTVVHIKAVSSRQQQRQMDIFDLFGEDFGMRRGSQKQESSGSGVVISTDGYIVTNNHVVENADQLEVVMSDKRTFKAKVIGTDPSTDLAVIQIPTKGLQAVTFGNSDAIKVGEWVVAVGNPFNLESTVTAGIVSAKGRGLPIISDKMRQQGGGKDSPIESFIQTDAVINPGNSGGALVNLRGELIGINTAIASPTGSFAGYAFAVPSSLVKKVSTDLVKFGGVQRGYVGLEPEQLDGKKAEEYDLKVNKGIYVKSFGDNPAESAAKNAGVRVGDVITKVDGQPVESSPEFRELVGRKRPGETVMMTINRDGATKDISVTLRNREGGRDIIKADASESALKSLGAEFNDLTDREKQRLQRYSIDGGVKVSSVQSGNLARVGVEDGFVITKIDGKAVKSLKDFKAILADKQGQRIQIEGLYIEYPEDVYSFGFPL